MTRREWIVRGAMLPGIAVMSHKRVPEAPPKPIRTRLMLGGDVMLSRHVGRLARSRQDPASPLRDIAPLFKSADIAFVNLEAPFSDRGQLVEQGLVFKAEPEMIEGLQLAGIDVVSTANNHARDTSAHGVGFTLEWLDRHGIAATGTGRTPEAVHDGVILERNGIQFGFLAYTYDQSNGRYKDTDDRIAVMDLDRMRQDVARLAKITSAVIVSMHAGIEYVGTPSPQQIEFARAAIDAGARVVAGHHPHVTQPWERYHNGVIFYSLGNLVFDQFQRIETQRGALAEVTFEGGVIAEARWLPVDIVNTVPRLAAGPSTIPEPGLPQPPSRSMARATLSQRLSPRTSASADAVSGQ